MICTLLLAATSATSPIVQATRAPVDRRVDGLTLFEGIHLRGRIRGTYGRRFGQVLTPLSDVDGDGTADFAVTSSPPEGTGRVAVFSGSDLRPIYELVGDGKPEGFPLAIDSFGVRVEPFIDRDGDSVVDHWCFGGDDFLGVPYRRLVSGANGRTLEHVVGRAGPSQPTTVPDLDGDGVPELAIRTDRGAGSTDVESSISGAPVGTIEGSYVRQVGDLDGDGRAEWVVRHGRHGGWSVVACTIEDAELRTSVVQRFRASRAQGLRGTFWDADLDGDGALDLVEIHDSPSGSSDDERGLSRFEFDARSGRSGEALVSWDLTVPPSRSLGWCGGLGDVSGDGCDDYAVTIWPVRGPCRLTIFSGRTGNPLGSIESHFSCFGFSACVVDDLDGDPATTELLIGAPLDRSGGDGGGAVYVVSIERLGEQR